MPPKVAEFPRIRAVLTETPRSPTPRILGNSATRNFKDVRPGQRVLAENPELEGAVVEPLEIEPDHWRLIRLKMAKSDGGTLSIELLRPVLWLQLAALETLLEDAEMDDEAIDAFLDHIEDEAGLRGVLLGSTIELDLEELGAAGPAEVVEIASCPQIEEGEGRIVTGTFSHTAANVIDVHVSGLAEPIGTTDTHPFWSEDRQVFVPAGELRVGEELRSLTGGQPRVTAIRPRGPPEAVYNLEVDGEHVYYVAATGLLVHNSCTESVYQLVDKSGDVVYYGITKDGRAAKRLAEHLGDPHKAGKIAGMQVLATGLKHDKARTLEAALIAKRLKAAAVTSKMSVIDQLAKAGLLNKNRGRILSRWLEKNPTLPDANAVLETFIKLK